MRFKYLHDWIDLVRRARDLCATPPLLISAQEQTFSSPRLKNVAMYVRRIELRAQEAIFINIELASLYLSHMLEVRSFTLWDSIWTYLSIQKGEKERDDLDSTLS